MKRLLTSLILLTSTVSFSKEFKLVELDEVYIDAYDVLSKRDPYFPTITNNEWGKGANFVIKNHFLKYMFWNNRIHLSGDQSQVRHVGYEFDTGFHIVPKILDVFYYHHSEHVTEEAPADMFKDSRRQFPIEDLIGIRVYLFKK